MLFCFITLTTLGDQKIIRFYGFLGLSRNFLSYLYLLFSANYYAFRDLSFFRFARFFRLDFYAVYFSRGLRDNLLLELKSAIMYYRLVYCG